jgi:glycosyltransferase involved in cell wall biosynthesis
MSRLAIVIPAYKPDFLDDALRSIERQTDRRFHVYVGDDAGPREVGEICRRFDGLDLTYHRFDRNLGRTSLPEHWNRCVRLSDEEWVWLFADDDEMAPDCVAAFHAQIGRLGDVDLVRFQTDTIDAHGNVVAVHRPHPPVESGVAFVWDRLRGERDSFAVEYVFRRDAFERVGGFPHYPMAWCADDAAWFTLSRRTGLHTLSGGRVRWRASGLNITGANRSHQAAKLEAALRYLDFVDREVRAPRPEASDSRLGPEAAAPAPDPGDAWDRVQVEWLLSQVRYLMPMGPAMLARTLARTRGRWRRGMPARLALLLAWNLQAVGRAARGYARRTWRAGRG